MHNSTRTISVVTVLILILVIISYIINYELKYIQRNLDQLITHLSPERRSEVADLAAIAGVYYVKIRGETSNAELFTAISGIKSNIIPVIIDVKLLPESTLINKPYALVNIGVANLRRSPSHQSELVDQAILGTKLNILKKNNGWYYVQTPWNYLGWVTQTSLVLLRKFEYQEYMNSNRLMVRTLNSQILEDVNPDALPLRDVTIGAQLRYTETNSDYYRVVLPDETPGYIHKNHIQLQLPEASSRTPQKDNIVKTAMIFHGIPYLWGGNSSKGLDCSGFTQTVFGLNGYMLPRDASMQVLLGITVIPDDGFDNVEPGDLIFFGPSREKITHVGISLGGGNYIHASSFVKINSLIPGELRYDAYRHHTIQVIKRL